MSIQANKNLFAEERAQRYNAAMDLYPSARYLELLPFMCMFARGEVRDWHLVDLASGGGYLGRFFENVARKVTYLDQSPDMLKHVDSKQVMVGDIRSASVVVGEEQADLVTCLAALHHVHVPEVSQINGTYAQAGAREWTPEGHLNIELSQQVQDATLGDWRRLLRPGGWLVLIDVPGYPDAMWDPFWPGQQRHALNTRGYQEQLLQRLGSWPLQTEAKVLEQFFSNAWQDLWAQDPHMQRVRELFGNGTKPNMQDLVKSYRLPPLLFKQTAPMVPTDFFDDVVDRLGCQRHFGYFPRESMVNAALQKCNMESISTGTFPTPWTFDHKESAVWFLHELFGLGSAWPRHSIPQKELAELTELVDAYLGLHEDEFGRTLLFWQLSYFVARKPLNHSIPA